MKVISGDATAADLIDRSTGPCAGFYRKPSGRLTHWLDGGHPAKRDTERGQVRLGGDLLSDVEQFRLGVRAMHRDSPEARVDNPNQRNAGIEIEVNLLLDLLVLI